LVRDENVLLDLFNVRYMVVPRQQSGALMFNDTRFHPAERLVNGGSSNPAGTETFRGSSTLADSMTVICAVDGMDGAEIGESMAEIGVISPDGEERRFGLRYGIELSGYRRGGTNPTNALWAYYGPAFVPNGRSFPAQLSGAVLPIDPPMVIDRVEVRYLAPSGVLLLHGLGLRDAETFTTRSLSSADRMKYTPVYKDEDVVILENQAALPKVYFRGGAATIPLDSPSAQDLMAAPRDLQREVVLDGDDAQSIHTASSDAHGDAQLLEYGTSTVRATTSADADGFMVVGDRFDAGWRAWVDGREAPVLRANAVLRAVPVPAGEHTVEMRYEPWWVTLGLVVSLLSLFVVVSAIVLCTRRSRERLPVAQVRPVAA